MFDAITAWDGSVLEAFQKLTENSLLDRIAPVYTHWGDIGQIWIILGIGLLLFKKTRRGGFLLLLSLLFTHILNNMVIKPLVMRVRPYETFPDIRLLVTPLRSSSFPSGHSATAFGSAVVLAIRERGLWRYVPLIFAVLMALSRLYVGAHYPTDVLTGALVGTLTAALTCLAAGRLDRRLQVSRGRS